jgi:hypothetical protein
MLHLFLPSCRTVFPIRTLTSSTRPPSVLYLECYSNTKLCVSRVNRLAQFLLYCQVAVAGWGTDNFPGGGIIIIPAEHSSALLVAALFFSPFPDILATRLNIPSPIMTQSQHHNPYSQPMSGTPISQYAPSGSRQSQSPTSFRRSHHQGSLSPIEQPISRAYRSPISREQPAHPAPLAPLHSAWPAVKDEDNPQYSQYSQHPGSHPRYPPPPPPRAG